MKTPAMINAQVIKELRSRTYIDMKNAGKTVWGAAVNHLLEKKNVYSYLLDYDIN